MELLDCTKQDSSTLCEQSAPLPCTVAPSFPLIGTTRLGVFASTQTRIKDLPSLLRPWQNAREIPEEGGSTASQVLFPPTSRVDGIQLSEIIYIIIRHFHTKPQALSPGGGGEAGQAGKLQSTHRRRVVKPISLIPLYTSHPAEPGHHPSAQLLAIGALDAEHFGLVVTRGRHHNGGVPGRETKLRDGAGVFRHPIPTPPAQL